MIKSIHLQNFQSHKDTFITFDTGVNAIMGLTDAGKTSILRAILWVVTNRPSGENFQSYWGGSTIVTIVLDDGTIIERGRTKTENYYKLNNHVFKAFGLSVPIEIEKVFNLNDINFMAQRDLPFLFSLSSGKVAQTFNKIVNLDVIDVALQTVKKNLKETNHRLKYDKEQEISINKQIEKFLYLIDMETDITIYEQLEKAFFATVKELSSLKKLYEEILDHEYNLRKYNKLCKAGVIVGDCLHTQQGIIKIKSEISILENIQYDIEKNEKILFNLNKKTKASKSVQECLKCLKEYKEEKASYIKLKELGNDIRQKGIEKERLDEKLFYLEKEFKKLMPKQCPLCGQEVKQ